MSTAKIKNNIPFKCPHLNISCPYVDALTSTLDNDCNTCHFKQTSSNKLPTKSTVITIIIVWIGVALMMWGMSIMLGVILK